MALNDRVALLRDTRIRESGAAVPDHLQGASKHRIRQVLRSLRLDGQDLIDGVFALLDNETATWFSSAPAGTKFADGATTAHLACHIGILQRGESKLDREGRDYWIKPLRELGAIEAVTLHNRAFIAGHVIPKSPNSAYRLDETFKEIITAPEAEWQSLLKSWASQDASRSRREFHARMTEAARQTVDTGHSDLIRASIEYYGKQFLPGFLVIYVDDGDGDRITIEDRSQLREAGVELTLGDAMPDVLLWNPTTDALWVIEAVTSDGEVDFHKVTQLRLLADRSMKSSINFTTAYRTWKEAAARQSAHQNIAVDTYIWIQADPARHFKVLSF